jgi:hypothetical protein
VGHAVFVLPLKVGAGIRCQNVGWHLGLLNLMDGRLHVTSQWIACTIRISSMLKRIRRQQWPGTNRAVSVER